MRFHRSLLACAALVAATAFAFQPASAQEATLNSSQNPVMHPGAARETSSGSSYSLNNEVVAAHWTVSDNTLGALTVTDKLHHTSVTLPAPFALLFKDGTVLTPASLHETAAPRFVAFTPQPNAARYSERVGGEEFILPLTNASGNLHLTWTLILRNGSNYIRQKLEIAAVGQDADITRVRLIDAHLPGAHVVGSVAGSPIVAGHFFLGFEHPLSTNNVTHGRAVAGIDRDLPLTAGQSITYSAVIGVARTGQMRRDFLRYIARERAHPYRTFLHYNSWYDLGYFTPYDEAGALNRINAFGEELHVKRGVKLDSFLFDDGWDNHHSIWDFNSGFPNGFTKVRAAAQKYGAEPGVWLSPWGGYDGPKKERIAYGKAHGYEIVNGGFALSGPKYYARFQQVCLQMIKKYGVNQFKFDGTGNVDSVVPGSKFGSDFDAAIHLIGVLRKAEPNLYVNLTTGTYPSPWWLFYADSIWRGGWDQNLAGVGDNRERWITYRDAATYAGIVKQGPLFPLNSLMLHGIIYARFNKELNTDPGNDFRNGVHDYFGTGTQLQEMYITPSLLTQQNWNDLAEAAKWSRANADVLRDTHWVGGDPAWLNVYGWAAWAPREGILTLRNPDNKPQSITLDIGKAFQLPEGAAQTYIAHSPWKSDAGEPSITLHAGVPHTFHLAPFEVLTLDMKPE